ncbi:Retrovirus-related Pol polyprotein from transposon TNT 1-94 [Sesamum angolense]|uniref:Retrovirus-related Pol polyprotein from transposon TNT 1-94 n=1 Tax=Sesamum angolense TaxID=2727404 RepID=A0AAE1W2Y5_9LAMI|nr:Retrovirus-related Pol polyprotein from transposon TNT 1-94 [Sesamum angolense]
MVVGGSSCASTSGATEGYVSVQPELQTIYEPCDWLIDTRVNVHVCADKFLFVSYQTIIGKTVSMGNSSTAEVLGIGSVELKFPSGRILSLKIVHHVPTVRRNIISGSDEALDKFILFKNEIETQTGKKLKRLRSDRGGEYESSKFNEYCQTFGIIHEETPPYSPSSNGVAERKNRTFKDMINSLLLTSGLPKYLWGEALNTACHILNRVPLKHNTCIAFELWKGRKPSLKYFRVWGCLAKVMVSKHIQKKLGPKTVDAVFLGYVETSNALKFLVIKSEIPGIEITNVGVNPNSTNLTHEESDIPRRSKRSRLVKDFGGDFVTYNIEDDPITFKDAMASSEAKQWKEAIKSEMDSIVSNGTWVLVDLPPGCTTIGCKWIFKKKLKPDGTIDKFKARLVAKGFKQKEGIDYFDTYFSVARLTTIRVLMALTSVYNLSIHQMDVKTAVLYGELNEEIYMDQPEGFVAHGGSAVSWKSAKQTLITRSIFEAELCALDTTSTEAEWLFGLLSQLSIASLSGMTHKLREHDPHAFRVQSSKPIPSDSSTNCPKPLPDSGETTTIGSHEVQTLENSSQPNTFGVKEGEINLKAMTDTSSANTNELISSSFA